MKIIEKFKNRNYVSHSITSEFLPLYHDKFMTKNKTVLELTYGDDRLTKVNLESQNGIAIKFHKDFENYRSKGFAKHTGLADFGKGGMVQGLIINMSGLGYLGEINSIYEIVLITDKFIYARDLQNNNICIKSHEEISRIKNLSCLEIIEK